MILQHNTRCPRLQHRVRHKQHITTNTSQQTHTLCQQIVLVHCSNNLFKLARQKRVTYPGGTFSPQAEPHPKSIRENVGPRMKPIVISTRTVPRSESARQIVRYNKKPASNRLPRPSEQSSKDSKKDKTRKHSRFEPRQVDAHRKTD